MINQISPQLRAIKAEIEEGDRIFLYAYFDGEIDQADEVSCHYIRARVEEDFDLSVFLFIDRLDYPQELPEKGAFVYLRYEPPVHHSADRFLSIPVTPYLETSSSINDTIACITGWALLGKVQPHFRVIQGFLEGAQKLFLLRFFLGCTAAEEDIEAINVIKQQIAAHIPSEYTVKASVADETKEHDSPWVTYFRQKEEIDPEDATQSEAIWEDLYTGKKFTFCDKALSTFDFFELARTTFLGNIRPSWRAIKFVFDQLQRKFWFWFYIDGTISRSDKQLIELCMKEFQVPYHSVTYQVIQCDFPEKLPDEGHFIFLREEASDNEVYDEFFNSRTSNCARRYGIFSCHFPRTTKRSQKHKNEEFLESVIAQKMVTIKKRLCHGKNIIVKHWRGHKISIIWYALQRIVENVIEEMQLRNIILVKYVYNTIEKKVTFLFITDNDTVTNFKEKLREAVEFLKTKFFLDCIYQAYIASDKSPIPTIGEYLFIRRRDIEESRPYSFENIYVCYSFRVLLGKISPAIRSIQLRVTRDPEPSEVTFFVFYNKECTVNYFFLTRFGIKFLRHSIQTIRCDTPAPVPQEGLEVYRRYEE